jgi:KaiC/GvpD/RAD55 family RecA-like ATPase
MSQQSEVPYHFDRSVPIGEIEPGTTVFVTGSSMSRAEDVALSLVSPGTEFGEASVLISTASSGEKLLGRCERLSDSFDGPRMNVIDCSGGSSRTSSQGSHIDSLSNPGDLTGMGIELSTTYERLYRDGVKRIRTGILSVSTLLMYTDVRTVFRFLHTLSGRIASIDGLGVFFIDPTSHDTESTNMLTQVSDGRIEVRESDDEDHESELRVRGLPDQPRDWQPFTLGGRTGE